MQNRKEDPTKVKALEEQVVEIEGQEATYWQDGDELPEGVEVGDIKTEAVEEVTREKTVKEYIKTDEDMWEESEKENKDND